jgi:uncharacterized protein (UPF0303 family)
MQKGECTAKMGWKKNGGWDQAGGFRGKRKPRYDTESLKKRFRVIPSLANGKTMNIELDLEKIALQEKRLQFKQFDSETAWAIGSALKAAAEKRKVSVAIDIQMHGMPLFAYAMAGITPDNWDWIRRKRNVVMRYQRSSYAIGLKYERAKTTLHAATGLELKDYAPHGGCFPILLTGTGCVGTIAVSGLPQREDHALVVEVLQEFLHLEKVDLALDSAT